MTTPMTPDLDAIRANAEGLTAVYRTHRQHHSAVRAAEVMAEGWAADPTATIERLAGALGVAIWQLTEAHDELTRLRPMEAALGEARELHAPYGIYDECGHDHTEEDIKAGRAVFVEGDYYSCADGLMYWACTVCCTWRTKDGELYGQSVDCANGGYGHDHDKTDKPICPTRAALDGGA